MAKKKPAKSSKPAKASQGGEEHLLLRQVEVRRRRHHESLARRQRARTSRADDQDRPARSARLHHHAPKSATTTTPTAREVPADSAGRHQEGGRHGSRRKPARSSATPRTRCSSRSAPRARDSMPGMMDTILNLGLNDATTEGLQEGHQQRPLRLGQLPPLRADVRRRGDGRAEAATRTSTSRSTR